MSCTTAFLSAIMDDEKRQAYSRLPQLESELNDLARRGLERWPNLQMDVSLFVTFLGRTLPASAAPHLRTLKAGDLWLACAYGRGIPNAGRCFEEHIIPPIETALTRLGISAPMIADILQNLRGQFVEVGQSATERQGYSGRGDLAGWLYVCAVREANRRRTLAMRNESLEESGAMLLPSEAEDPEMAYIQATYRRELNEAFREALALLTSKERNLLRYYFIEKKTIDQIGALYRVHRVTALRWINGARENLCERTRTLVCQRISLSEDGFDRILGLIASQIHAHLAMDPG